ncbi:MAG: hypothetical protein LBJ42_00300 [Holosporales bacterium]|nr:hypothetical protein [Holosporales bacterium]
MNVKCPYCGCLYNVGAELLRNPSGDENLGYGWWLRCYKCHKKWWLKNTEVDLAFNAPLTADRQARIDRLSSLTGKRKIVRNVKRRKFNITKVAVFIVIATCAYELYLNRGMFYDYIISKARRTFESSVPKISVADVKYSVIGANITVTGVVVNDDMVTARINSIKVIVSDGSSEILSWTSEPEASSIPPGRQVEFSTNHSVPGEIKNMRVKVLIF